MNAWGLLLQYIKLSCSEGVLNLQSIIITDHEYNSHLQKMLYSQKTFMVIIWREAFKLKGEFIRAHMVIMHIDRNITPKK